MVESQGLYLRSVATDRANGLPDSFPFSVPAIGSLGRLDLTAPVTFLVGENGCGKSTLLEAIACAVGSITVGSESVDRDATLASIRVLARHLKLTWTVRTRRGFFMRAEDFFGYARKLAMAREELQRDLERAEEEAKGRSRTAQFYARAAFQGQIAALDERYARAGGPSELDARSHGESFLDLFQSRFVPGGLYLLDEPEAPLSPVRQMSFLVLLKQMVQEDAQFIIATHSPILMAYPGAVILSMDGGKIEALEYDDLDHVRITRDFLNHRDSYLRSLLADE
jgi:predicted ATPase